MNCNQYNKLKGREKNESLVLFLFVIVIPCISIINSARFDLGNDLLYMYRSDRWTTWHSRKKQINQDIIPRS